MRRYRATIKPLMLALVKEKFGAYLWMSLAQLTDAIRSHLQAVTPDDEMRSAPRWQNIWRRSRRRRISATPWKPTQAVTDRVVAPPQGVSFVISRKSMLQPVRKIFFLGKWLDLQGREIRSHPRAFLQMFHAWVGLACTSPLSSRLLPKIPGFLQWHVRPHVGSGPHPAGAYCHGRWGTSGLPTPVKVLHSLVTVMVRCAEPWRPPAHSEFQVARNLFVSGVTLLEFFGPSIFVDATLDNFGFRVGGVIPGRGVRSWLVQDCITNQQVAELQQIAWAVRLAAVLDGAP